LTLSGIADTDSPMEPLNTITTQNRQYLLAWSGHGCTVHLVAEAEGEGAIAVAPLDDEIEDRPLNPAYDEADLRAEAWAPRTLCGRDGWYMAATAAGPVRVSPSHVLDEDPTEVAPSCRRCLQILDRQFPPAKPDDLLDAMVERCVTELSLWNCVMVDRVPGPQMPLLRAGIRAGCRKRGWKIESVVRGTRLMVSTEDAVTPERQMFLNADMWRRVNSEPGTVPAGSWRVMWGC
jgi:hypothetical protein